MDALISVRLYLVVVQSILLLGSYNWVVTSLIGKTLGCFRRRFTMRIMGKQPQRQAYEIWKYPLLVYAMWDVGL